MPDSTAEVPWAQLNFYHDAFLRDLSLRVTLSQNRLAWENIADVVPTKEITQAKSWIADEKKLERSSNIF